MFIALLKEVYNAGHKAGWNECELCLKEQAWQKERKDIYERHEDELMEYFRMGKDEKEPPAELILNDLEDV